MNERGATPTSAQKSESSAPATPYTDVRVIILQRKKTLDEENSQQKGLFFWKKNKIGGGSGEWNSCEAEMLSSYLFMAVLGVYSCGRVVTKTREESDTILMELSHRARTRDSWKLSSSYSFLRTILDLYESKYLSIAYCSSSTLYF